MVGADVKVDLHEHVERAGVSARDRIGEELVVRNRDEAVVERHEAHGAQTDLDDLAVEAREGDAVANLKGPIEQDDDAGDHRRHQVLEREADRDRDRAAEAEHGFVGEAKEQPHRGSDARDEEQQPEDRLRLLKDEATVRETFRHAPEDTRRSPRHQPRGDEHEHRRHDAFGA